ncbi:MAG: hypothetical protein N2169_04605 [bacterium]|nr:hypothetical protein [bacterium]
MYTLGLKDSEVEYYLRNPRLLSQNIFDRLYARNLERILDRINSRGSGGFPFIGLAIGSLVSIFSILLMLFSCFVYFNMSYAYRYMYGDFIFVCFLFGLILFFLSFFVGGFLVFFQKTINMFKKKQVITRDELRRRIESEAEGM